MGPKRDKFGTNHAKRHMECLLAQQDGLNYNVLHGFHQALRCSYGE